MTEEQVTKAILSWLKNHSWFIVSFDFPQSGTGTVLHLNENIRDNHKNKGAIIPDIIAVKNSTCVFFENKDKFVLDDFLKVNNLRTTNDYSESIFEITKEYSIKTYYYGVGLPYTKSNRTKVNLHKNLIDFIIEVKKDFSIINYFSVSNVF